MKITTLIVCLTLVMIALIPMTFSHVSASLDEDFICSETMFHKKISPRISENECNVAVILNVGTGLTVGIIDSVRCKFKNIQDEGYSTGERDYLIYGTLRSSDAIYDIAANSYVQYIDEIPVGAPFDEVGVQIVGGGFNINNPNSPYRANGYGSKFSQATGLSGVGITIGIADTGLGNGVIGNAGHVDFGNRVIGGKSYTTGTSWRDDDGHGTACAGLIAANGRTGTGTTYAGFGPYYVGMGLAYGANLYVQKIFNDKDAIMVSDVGKILQDAYAADVQIVSNSWGHPLVCGGDYHLWDRQFDYATRNAAPGTPGNHQILAVVAAGNSGPNSTTIHPPGNAKNVLTVGASHNYMPDSGNYGNSNYDDGIPNDINQIWCGSSRGWTADSRIKPDIVAPGYAVLTTNSPGVTNNYPYKVNGTQDLQYRWFFATSAATPTVAGGAALVYQWYQQKTGVAPTPAMTKALLINTAKPMGSSIPNRDEGWGRMYLTPISDNPDYFYMKDAPAKLKTGEYHEYQVAYMDNTKPLKVTLVWTDPAANVSDRTPLENDLWLKVYSPTGEVYFGNAFSGLWTPDGTPPISPFCGFGDNNDNRNNVENIFIEPGLETGKYTIRVSGYFIDADCDGDGTKDQDYALVVYNGAEDNTPPDSKVSQSAPYWRTTTSNPITITATASDAVSGVKDVSLWYQYRATTTSAWGDWLNFGPDTAAPWSWSFPWPSGEGHYQFRTIATDNAGNVEAVPTSPDFDAVHDSTFQHTKKGQRKLFNLENSYIPG